MDMVFPVARSITHVPGVATTWPLTIFSEVATMPPWHFQSILPFCEAEMVVPSSPIDTVMPVA